MPTAKRFSASDIATELEHRIVSGVIKRGAYLASVRALSQEFGCATLTAHRALRRLTEDGLLVAEPRHGFCVAPAPGGKSPREVAAFLQMPQGYADARSYYGIQLGALQCGALNRGWLSTVIPYTGQPLEDIAVQLREMKATALFLQEVAKPFPPDLMGVLAATGLPIVSLDLVDQVSGADQIARDEAHGAALAAEFLLRKGHRQIAWYGQLTDNFSSRRRYSGAAEVLLREKIPVLEQGWIDCERPSDTAVAKEFLLRTRPRAVLALWQNAALAVARAARELGWVLGRDLDLAGWALEEELGQVYPADCPELLESCATATWSMNELVSLIFNRIDARRREPGVPVARLLLPMKLREPSRQSFAR